MHLKLKHTCDDIFFTKGLAIQMLLVSRQQWERLFVVHCTKISSLNIVRWVEFINTLSNFPCHFACYSRLLFFSIGLLCICEVWHLGRISMSRILRTWLCRYWSMAHDKIPRTFTSWHGIRETLLSIDWNTPKHDGICETKDSLVRKNSRCFWH